MDKEDETGSVSVRALTLLMRWMQEETNNNKVRQTLSLLAERTRSSLQKGEATPLAEVAQMAAWHSDRFGGPWIQQTATGRWLPSQTVRTWWDTRENSRRQFLASAGVAVDIQLDIDKGGGRSNATTYRYRFEPLTDSPRMSAEDSVDDGLGTDARIRYKREPARAGLAVRPTLGRPFAVRSVRGFFFVLTVAFPFAISVICAAGIAWLALTRSPALKILFSPLLTVGFLAGLTTLVLRPLWSLPLLRITVAPDWMLAMSQMYGQFRLTHDDEKKTGGHFSLVRHWSRCSICSGTVEIRDGGAAFPGRLVGCCSDNPREHVYSFDAVTLTGALLIGRQDIRADARA
jgi:hypothetical protein